MASTLTTEEKDRLRRRFRAEFPDHDKLKSVINGGLDGLDDWFESNRASLKTALETGAGVTFTNAQAKALGKWWLQTKFRKGG